MEPNIIYIPVEMFIRTSRKGNEPAERALLIARRKDDGREYAFVYEDINGADQDLTVCNYKPLNQ